MPLALSIPPENIRKTVAFSCSQGGRKRDQWHKMGEGKLSGLRNYNRTGRLLFHTPLAAPLGLRTKPGYDAPNELCVENRIKPQILTSG